METPSENTSLSFWISDLGVFRVNIILRWPTSGNGASSLVWLTFNGAAAVFVLQNSTYQSNSVCFWKTSNGSDYLLGSSFSLSLSTGKVLASTIWKFNATLNTFGGFEFFSTLPSDAYLNNSILFVKTAKIYSPTTNESMIVLLVIQASSTNQTTPLLYLWNDLNGNFTFVRTLSAIPTNSSSFQFYSLPSKRNNVYFTYVFNFITNTQSIKISEFVPTTTTSIETETNTNTNEIENIGLESTVVFGLGAIIGVAVAGFVLILIVCILIVCLVVRSRRNRNKGKQWTVELTDTV